MQVRCPKCNETITLDDEEFLDTVQCPTCKTGVEVVQMLSFSDETTRLDTEGSVETRLRPGEKIAHFVIMRELGSGGFGRVYLAQDNKLDRQVALKVPRAGRLSSQEVKVFIREARTTAQLRDPNILVVHEVGRHRDIIYIASDFIDGPTLSEKLKKDGPMRPREAARLCVKIAQSLHRAHSKNIVHRDLKTGNILLDERGEPFIADFGLAKRSSSEELTIARPGEVLGTPSYMPPEQASGKSHYVDARADIYSLGAILYETITGKRLFGGSREQVIEQIRSNQQPPRPREIDRRIPIVLDSICLKAIAKDPNDRFGSAREMAEELDRFIRQQPPRTIPQSWATRTGLLVRRRWREICIGAVCVVLVALPLIFRPPSPPVADNLQSIVVSTQPPGAAVAMARIDDRTGYPDEENVIRPPGETPLTVQLEPGTYLVVAMLDRKRFHEVYRTVPSSTDEVPMTYPSRQWEKDEGEVHWPQIDIAASLPNELEMIRVEADSSNDKNLKDFFIANTETTYAQLRSIEGFSSVESGLPDDWPVRNLAYGRALEFAELAGCRLPTWDEYKFAATNGQTTAFPWGQDAELGLKWSFGPAGFAAHDRTSGGEPILGLLSNVAEWTTTTFVPQTPQSLFVPGAERFRESRIVFGGTTAVCTADYDQTIQLTQQDLREAMKTPSFRLVDNPLPGLGFRCVRSVRPRWLADEQGADWTPLP